MRFIALLFTLTLLTQRICIPTASSQIPIALPLFMLGVVYGLYKNILAISINRLLIFIAFLFVISIELGLNENSYSSTSLWYLISIYVFFVCCNARNFTPAPIFIQFRQLMTALAVLGIFQFLIQFVFSTQEFDPFDGLPEGFLIQGYNLSSPIEYGSHIYKSNGYFCLEPSFFSQYMALALIVEILFFKQVRRMVLFVMALLCSFSGTGFILLGVAMLGMMTRSRKGIIQVAAIASLLGLWLMTPYADFVTRRIGEFGVPGTSAHIRFVAPYLVMAEMLNKDLYTALIGLGPGASNNFYTGIQANYPPVAKIIIEYGLIGGSLFLLFIAYCFTRRPINGLLSLALAITYLVLSGALLQPVTAALIYWLSIVNTQRRHA